MGRAPGLVWFGFMERKRSSPVTLTKSRNVCFTLFCALGAFVLLLRHDGGEAEAADPVGERVYQSVMQAHPRYPRSTSEKALTGCFDWEKSTPDDPDVRYLAVAWRMKGRGGMALAQIVNRAMIRCETAQRRDQAPCTCQVIDRNGKNVLEPPAQFIERFD